MIVINKASSVFAAIEKIAATASTKEKEALVAQAVKSSPLFGRVVVAAYNRTTYGIAKIPHKTPGIAPGANTLDESWPWEVLEKMAARELTGDAMRDKVQQAIDLLDEPSSQLFRRILGKDMRAGFTDGTVDRAVPGTVAAKVPYMRCTLPKKSNIDSWDWSMGHFSQEKHDGQFLNVTRQGEGSVDLSSRQGSVYPVDKLSALVSQLDLVLPPDTQAHGEGLIFRDGKLLPRAEGNGIWTKLLSDDGQLGPNEKAVVMLWDMIPIQAAVPKGKCATPYVQRLKGLVVAVKGAREQGVTDVHVSPTRIVKSKAEAWAHYRELLAIGREGTVVKHRNMDWKDTSSGNKDQVKLKLEAQFELIMRELVAGAEGKKNAATFGSIRCESACGKLIVDVPGYTDARRQQIFNDWEERFKGRIMTVKGNSVMEPSESNENYSIFLPGHVEVREDKVEADTLEQIMAIFEAAKEAA